MKIVSLMSGLLFLSFLVFNPAKLLAQESTIQAQSSSIPIQSEPEQSTSSILTEKSKESWPWYLVRASGLLAFFLLFMMIVSGIGQVAGYSFRYLEPITAWATHRATGIAFTVAVAVHIFGILIDKFVSFNIWDILIPFKSDFKPVEIFGHNFGSLYVTFGIVAVYALLIIIITSYIWIDRKPQTWKIFHLTSYLIVALIFVHGLFLGTDISSGFLRIIWIILGFILMLLVLYRLWRVRTT